MQDEVARIMAMSDEEILAACVADGLDPEKVAADGRAALARAIVRANATPLRDRIALEIWHRFSDSHVEDWEDEPHKQEFFFCADAIVRRVWEKLTRPTPEMISAAYDQQAIIPEESWPAMLGVAMQREKTAQPQSHDEPASPLNQENDRG